jgi:hypothetical protein
MRSTSNYNTNVLYAKNKILRDNSSVQLCPQGFFIFSKIYQWVLEAVIYLSQQAPKSRINVDVWKDIWLINLNFQRWDRDIFCNNVGESTLSTISETLWNVATFGDQQVASVNFSATALQYLPRISWTGWDFRHQYDQLKLTTNNLCFLILPVWQFPNLDSHILSLWD